MLLWDMGCSGSVWDATIPSYYLTTLFAHIEHLVAFRSWSIWYVVGVWDVVGVYGM